MNPKNHNRNCFEKQKDVVKIIKDLLVKLENSKEIIIFNGEV